MPKKSIPPIVKQIVIGIGPDLTVTVDESTIVPSPQQTKRWHAYVRKRALAVQGNSVVQDFVALIRSIIFIPEGGFTDSIARWTWQRWAESECFMFTGPGAQDLINNLTEPYTLTGAQAIPPTIPRILDLAIKRVEAIEELTDDDWWLWVHSLFVLHTAGDPAVVMPTPAKLPLESLTYRQAARERRRADDRGNESQRSELLQLQKAILRHHKAGMSPYKIGTQTSEGRRFMELKGRGANEDRRKIIDTICAVTRKHKQTQTPQVV